MSNFLKYEKFQINHFENLILQNLFNLLVFNILLSIMLLTGSRLDFPPALIFPLFAVLIGANGLAFTIGALALLFKQVNQLQVIFQFGLLFFFAR